MLSPWLTHAHSTFFSVFPPAASSFTVLAAGGTSKRGRTQRGAGPCVVCVCCGSRRSTFHPLVTHTHCISLLQINYFQLPLESLMPNKAMGTCSREAFLYFLMSVYWLCVSKESLTYSYNFFSLKFCLTPFNCQTEKILNLSYSYLKTAFTKCI